MPALIIIGCIILFLALVLSLASCVSYRDVPLDVGKNAYPVSAYRTTIQLANQQFRYSRKVSQHPCRKFLQNTPESPVHPLSLCRPV